MKSSLLDDNFVSKLLDFKAKLIYTHVDKINKNEWVARKVNSLRHNHRYRLFNVLLLTSLSISEYLNTQTNNQILISTPNSTDIIFNSRILIEPSLISKFLQYNQELDAGKEPKGEDFVNKKYMKSNDIFCLVYSLLIVCDPRFSKCFSYIGRHNECLVKFNRQYFKDLFNDLMFSISDDKNLVFVLKKLLDIEKYKSGKRIPL